MRKLVIKPNYAFPKVQLSSQIIRRGGSHLVFPSRVDTFKLSGPGLAWGEALFE